MIVYGIKNCNTVKAALAWLTKNNTEFEFHDLKTKGIRPEKLQAWCRQAGWERLVNRRGTTWRQLDASLQQKITDESSAIRLMQEKTSVIKRPLLEKNGKLIAVGFEEDVYRSVV